MLMNRWSRSSRPGALGRPPGSTVPDLALLALVDHCRPLMRVRSETYECDAAVTLANGGRPRFACVVMITECDSEEALATGREHNDISA